MSLPGMQPVSLKEMIKVVKEERINLKNAGDLHRAKILQETAEYLQKQLRNGNHP